jgi:DNA-binding response OmpR family regulator
MKLLQVGYTILKGKITLKAAKAFIIIIEDEPDLLELLEYHLQKEGYEVEGFLSTKNVSSFLEEESPDIMIVDRNLPGVEGSEYVKNLRQKGIDIPVIFLSAKDSLKDIEEGFLRGGDDYVTKPFEMRELLLRVKAVLKRSKGLRDILVYKDIKMDLNSREVLVGGKKIELTKLEFDLLSEFIKNKNQVLSRDYLLEHIWQDGAQERSVNVAIKRLKAKIDPKKEKNYIDSIWGVGYKLI